jgi:hypothetical protein
MIVNKNRLNFGEIVKDVEIMRAGTHTSSSGDRVTFTDDDLEAIARAYNPQYSEAPVVIGHPVENGPAYGWVKALEAVGGRLLATLDLVPEFVEAVRQGLFKKRSASIYHDLDGKGRYLRHVGFLGAMPPAVKALSDINLAESQPSATFEFADKERPMSWKEKVKGLFTQAVDEIPEAGAGITPIIISASVEGDKGGVSFSEDQVLARERAAAEAAARKAREEAQAEFAEQMRQTLEAEAARTHAAAVKAKIDALVSQGRVHPAWVASGLVEFASALPWRDADQAAFAEGGTKTPHDWFLDFLEALPASVSLSEVAGRDKDVTSGGAAARLNAMIRRKLEANPKMSHATAFAEVQLENPGLAEEYRESIRP